MATREKPRKQILRWGGEADTVAVHKPFLNLSLQGGSHSCPFRGPTFSFPLRRPFPTEAVAYLISKPSQEVPLSCSPPAG